MELNQHNKKEYPAMPTGRIVFVCAIPQKFYAWDAINKTEARIINFPFDQPKLKSTFEISI